MTHKNKSDQGFFRLHGDMKMKAKVKQKAKKLTPLPPVLKKGLTFFIENAYSQSSKKELRKTFQKEKELKVLKYLDRLLNEEDFIQINPREYDELKLLISTANLCYVDSNSDILIYIFSINQVYNFLDEKEKAKLEFMLEGSLLGKIEFYTPKQLLMNVTSDVLKNSKYKNIVLNKIIRMKSLTIEKLEAEQKEHLLIVKVKGYKKKEIIQYYSKCIMPYNVALPEQDLQIYNQNNELVLEKKDIKCIPSLDLTNLYKMDKHLDLRKPYIRFLIINHLRTLKSNKILYANEALINEIYRYDNLFKLDAKYVTSEVIGIGSWIKKLEENPSKENYHKIINKIDNGDILYSIFIFAKGIRGIENDVDDNIAMIKRFKKLNYYDLKVGIFFEENLKDTPVIIDDVIDFLKSMYSNNLYTANSRQMLEYVKSTSKIKDSFIDEALLDIKSKELEFDPNFFVALKSLYESNKNNKKVYEIVNRVIMSGKDIRPCYEIVYDFYKKFLDVHALKKYLEVSNILGQKVLSKLTIKDCKFIVAKILEKSILEEIDDEIIIKIIEANILEGDEKFKKDAQKVIEGILENSNVESLKGKENILSTLSKQSEVIYHKKIELLLNKPPKEFSKDDIKILEQYMKTVGGENEEAIKASIEYYISKDKEEIYINYINYYISSDVYKSEKAMRFRKFIIHNAKNAKAIKTIINLVEFDHIECIDELLRNTIKHHSSYDKEVFFAIVDYYKRKNKDEKAVELILELIEKIKGLEEFEYSLTIIPMMEEMTAEEKKKLYIKLIPCNMPIEFRCINHYLDKENIFNNQEIMKSFEVEELDNIVAKSLILEKYYNENDKFCDAYLKESDELYDLNEEQREYYDKQIKDLIYKKVKENFADVAKEEFLKALLLNSKYEFEHDYIALLEERYLQEFGKKNIIKDMIVCVRDSYEVVDFVKLKGIFTNEILDYELLQFDFYLKKILLEYMKEDFSQKEIGEETYIITEKPKEGQYNVLKFMEKVKKLVKLQDILIKNEVIMVDFRNETLKELNNSIGIDLREIKELNNNEVRLRKKEYSYLNSILKSKKYPVINEKNSIKLISLYMEKHIKENYKDDYDEFMKWNISRKQVELFEEYLSEIENFIKEKTTLFHERSIKKKITMFEEENLSYEDKLEVIEYILKNELLDIKAKKIILENCEIQNTDNLKNYLKYYLRCFNDSITGLVEEDLLKLFDLIIDLIKSNKIDMIKFIEEEKKLSSRLETFILSASKKTKFPAKEIFDEIKDLKFLDVERLEKKLL